MLKFNSFYKAIHFFIDLNRLGKDVDKKIFHIEVDKANIMVHYQTTEDTLYVVSDSWVHVYRNVNVNGYGGMTGLPDIAMELIIRRVMSMDVVPDYDAIREVVESSQPFKHYLTQE